MGRGSGRVFLGGLPYEPDLLKLREHVGVPAVGTLVPYAAIEACLGCSWRSARFKGVCDAWRRKLEAEGNVILVGVAREGFRVLTAPERVRHAESYLRQGARRIRRSHAIVGTTPHDGLDEAQRTRAQALFGATSRHYTELAATVKALAPPPKATALPRAV